MMQTHSTKLRWGILGAAKINRRLLPAFAKAPHVELRAIASRSLDKAKAAAREANIPIAYGSYEALLDDPEIDIVYNPLPNNLHGEWTRKAADRGKHVLCEKPLTPTAAEAESLVAYCQEKGVLLTDGFMWPHHPRTAKLRQVLDSGRIGAIRRISSAFTFQMKPLDPENIRLKPEMGGGSLLDIGCYPVYAIRWAMQQEPVRVYASAEFQHGVDVTMNAMLWFSQGQVAMFDCGFTLPYRIWLEITGAEGVIRVPEMWLPLERATFTIHHDEKPVEEVTIEGENQIVHMLENFTRAVMEKKPVCPPITEAIESLRVMDALARSAREERVIAL